MKIKKWKKIIFAAALLAVLAISGISALFTDGDTMANIFTVGKVDIELREPNWRPDTATQKMLNITPKQEFAKDPQISNIGENAAYVFMEVVVPYANITTVEDDGGNEETADTPLFSYDVNAGWVQVGDTEKNTVLKTITRRYAYGTDTEMTALAKGDTTAALFNHIRFANVVEDQATEGLDKLEGLEKEVVINAYAIQTDNINDGNIISDGDNGNGKVKPADVWEVLFNQRLVNYTPLEYIESTGSQYINTGFKPNQDTRVVCDFQFTGVGSEEDYHLGVFGARQTTDPTTAFVLGYRYGQNSGSKTQILRSDYTGDSNGLVISPEDLVKTRFKVDKNKNATTINGQEYHATENNFSVSQDMFLFTFNSNGAASRLSELRMYSCKIYDDGKLVRDYGPGINSEGKVGMYDAVTKQFYGPAAGTGNFIAGQYVLDDYVHNNAKLILDGIWNDGEGVHSDTLEAGWVDLSGNCAQTPLNSTANTVGTNCISSDGTPDGKMIVPNPEHVNLTEFTFEVIYKKDPSDTRNAVICGRDYLTSYYTNISDGNLCVWLGDNGTTVAYGLDYSKAHTLQLTCNGTTATAWVDGVKIAENISANVQNTEDNLMLFGRKDDQCPMEGSIFAVRIHDRILSDEELAQNYEIDKKRFGL